MRRVDVTVEMQELDGTTIQTAKSLHDVSLELCAECSKKVAQAQRALTLRLVSTRSLTAMLPSRSKESGQTKFERAVLARRIHEATDVKLDHDELKLLRTSIGEHEKPEVILQAWEILDSAPACKEEES